MVTSRRFITGDDVEQDDDSRRYFFLSKQALGYFRYIYVALITLYGGGMTYLALQPEVGFDDANIAQAYARNIANGHGYVYNVGGERVEGSTSIIWTLLNSVFFYFSNNPEFLLGIFSLFITGLIIFTTCKIAEFLIDNKGGGSTAFLLAGFAFVLFPEFFGWMVWSLMDMNLWIISISLLALCLPKLQAASILNQTPAKHWRIIYFTTVLLTPVVRPEGIALTSGLAIVLLVYAFLSGEKSVRLAVTTFSLGLFTFLVSAVARLIYFGYPFPNTYYAKTSDNILEQTLQGTSYTISYFQQVDKLGLFIAFVLGIILIIRRANKIQNFFVSIAAATILGGLLIYTMLGGDHFASHRFYLYFIVLEIPVVTFLLVSLRQHINVSHRLSLNSINIIALGLLLLLFILQSSNFLKDKGGYQHEFWIAEHGRYVGDRLNEFPGEPSLGVLAAGGIRMGFHGKIYDVLGLNWTKMAHAESKGKTNVKKNHGAFNADLFMRTLPDIFYPNEITCPAEPFRFNNFFDSISDGIVYTTQFMNAYDYVCWKDLTFFISRQFAKNLVLEGELPELQRAAYLIKKTP